MIQPKLEEKIALLIGGEGSLQEPIAQALAVQGAFVVLARKNPQAALGSVKEVVEAIGGVVRVVPVPKDPESFFRAFPEQFEKPVDILILIGDEGHGMVAPFLAQRQRPGGRVIRVNSADVISQQELARCAEVKATSNCVSGSGAEVVCDGVIFFASRQGVGFTGQALRA